MRITNSKAPKGLENNVLKGETGQMVGEKWPLVGRQAGEESESEVWWRLRLLPWREQEAILLFSNLDFYVTSSHVTYWQ